MEPHSELPRPELEPESEPKQRQVAGAEQDQEREKDEDDDEEKDAGIEPEEIASGTVPRVHVRIGSTQREDRSAVESQPQHVSEPAPEEATEHAPKHELQSELDRVQASGLLATELDHQEESWYAESAGTSGDRSGDAVSREIASSVDTSYSRESLTDEVRFGSTYFRQIKPEPLHISRDQNVKDHFRYGAGLVGVLDPSRCPGRLTGDATDQADDELRLRKEQLVKARSVSNELNRQPRIGERLQLGNYDTDEEIDFQETHKRQSDAARKEATAYRNMLAQQDWSTTEEGYDGDLAPRELIIPAPAAGFYAWFGEEPTSENSSTDDQNAATKWWHHPANIRARRGQGEGSEYLEGSRPSSATSSRPGSATSTRPGSASSKRSDMTMNRSTSSIANRESVDLAGRVRPHSAASRMTESESFISDTTMSVRSSGSAVSLRVPKVVSPSRASFDSVSSPQRRRPASATSMGAFGTRNTRVELWRSKERKAKSLRASGALGPSRKKSDWPPAANSRLLRRSADGWLTGAGSRTGQAQRPRTANQLYAEHRARKQATKSGKSRGKPKGTGQLQMDLGGGGKAGLLTLLSQSTVWQS